ncbi:GntR family transcriptional regulator [Pseudonocardia spinosispora]|uniref:GntR family transcriptional regulator n=1 Tax=Pseudonocardia spinosispora TaxID=103441 RepID=UPI0003F572D9|nr:GntR family transcriptional regulator [Pseudonocardia spinosispora]
MAHGSEASRVADALRQRLLTGDLPSGTRLSQGKLAAEYGVSRIPVRDALQLLAAEGFLDIGPSVALVRELSIAELQELYDLRLAVEPMLTRFAVPNVGLAEITRMESLEAEMESGPEPRRWLAANAEFHAQVYTRGNRPRMIELTTQLRRLIDRYLHLHVGMFGDMAPLHAEHRAILDAVRAGNADQAAELTREHLANSHRLVLGYLLEHELLGATAPR